DAGVFTFDDAHTLTAGGTWSVRACMASTCVGGSSILASKALTVLAAPVRTTLTVGAASGMYFGTATLTATLVTTSNSAPIARATSAVNVDCPVSLLFTGAAQEPCTASVTGAGGLEASLPIDYAGNTLGTAGASATYGGDGNHTGDTASASFRIVYAWSGFD